jgi:hypothetical protein
MRQPQDGGMKLALFIVVILVACANELVLSVKKEQDEAMSAASLAPETLREKLANLLAPVLALLYIVALPLAFIALLRLLFVFAPALALALALMLLVPATSRLLRRKAGFSRVEFRGSQASEVPPCEPRTAPGSGRSRHCPSALHTAQALKLRKGSQPAIAPQPSFPGPVRITEVSSKPVFRAKAAVGHIEPRGYIDTD